MSILTVHELEFLASLRTGWSVLYRKELARLLKELDGRRRPRASSQLPGGRDLTGGAVVCQFHRPSQRT